MLQQHQLCPIGLYLDTRHKVAQGSTVTHLPCGEGLHSENSLANATEEVSSWMPPFLVNAKNRCPMAKQMVFPISFPGVTSLCPGTMTRIVPGEDE